MKNNPHYIKVVLDKDAKIVDLECTLRDVALDTAGMIGKNWFDTFIETSDKEEVLKIFSDIFKNQTKKWKTFENDIKISDRNHKFIDFTNEIFSKDGEKYIVSFGVEHIDNFL